MFYKLEGIVFRETKFKENDKVLTIFTKEQGKIQAIAKGARNPKNKLFASTQNLCHSEFVLYKGKNLYNVNQGEIKTSFYNLREDLIKLAYATYIIELVDLGTIVEENNEKLYYLLIKTLKVLSKLESDYEKLTRAFEIKYMSFLGYKPNIKNCVSCGNELNDIYKFSIKLGGILCGKCLLKDSSSIKIDNNIKKILNYLLYSPLDKLNDVKFDNASNLLVESILRKYIIAHNEIKEIKSLEFLKSVK